MKRRAFAAGVVWLALGVVANGCFDVRKYPGPALCTTTSECDDGTVCTRDSCQDGSCEHEPLTADGPDDGNACTRDRCAAGVELHEPSTKTPMGCGMFGILVCDAAGQCTQCTAAVDCGTDDACRTWRCDAGVCEALSSPAGTACAGQGVCDGRGSCARCDDGLQNGGETDVDCGGRCVGQGAQLACAEGQYCDRDSDCASGTTCESGVCCGAACAP